MQAGHGEYEIVIGLEVHAQLQTNSKLFCGDAAVFGAEPNTNISAISLAYPGTLPKTNGKAIELAVKMGLACGSEIVKENYFARKNYFYPDLPKGYQVSQHTTPICKGGTISITINGVEKKLSLNRIHLEEDAGKSLHDVDAEWTSIDLNRAGIALIEIVTEPDLRSADEAQAFIIELRRLVRYLDVCDGNMEEGSLRCDANISVRKKGAEKLGTKVEVKNLNSTRHVKKAIEYEAERMINMLERGEEISQQTRSFEPSTNETFSIRDKEDAEDYRYFADPDLSPFILSDEFIADVARSIPELQSQKISRYKADYHLSDYDAGILTEEKSFAVYFERVVAHTTNHKAAANWMIGPVRSWLNAENSEIDSFPARPEKIAELISIIDEGRLNFSIASAKLFPLMVKRPDDNIQTIIEENDWIQSADENEIRELIDEVLNKFPDKVKEYKKGKKGLIGLFVGEVIKLSGGKADPKITTGLLTQKLKT
jgi:aspartyl-tRNA(Asn)/glutamyl-tRNA(Gln) amidotransferase subunit B